MEGRTLLSLLHVVAVLVAKKTSQLGDRSPAIPRLGVPAYKWWSEALHGISNQGRDIHLDGPLRAATSFPQVILTAASFNPHLWYRIGQASTDAKRIIDEERANARLDIGSAKASVQKIQSALKEQETISHRTGKQAPQNQHMLQNHMMWVSTPKLKSNLVAKHQSQKLLVQ
uniref:Stomatal closure-related actin-binding protein coiled-coil domain-containing protein n=1 Tax=Zea mays TaxID=4577 RepID=A0A804PTD3_MAIZE